MGFRMGRLLLSLACLLSACDRAKPRQPSVVLRGAPAGAVADMAAKGLRVVAEKGHRTVGLEPPGHHFATFLVVGEIDPAALDGLLDRIAAACAEHVVASGGRMIRPCDNDLARLPAGTAQGILSRPPAGADLRGRSGSYRIGDREGFVTVLAMPDPDEPKAWRIGGAWHEAR